MSPPGTRNTLFEERAKILMHETYPGNQYVLRLHAPQTAAHAKPGGFVHMQCDTELLMRRPMSIMRAHASAGNIDILYKAHGLGTSRLTQKKIGDTLDLLGPIGIPFKLEDYRKFPVLIGGGVGIPPMVFLAEHIKKTANNLQPLVIMGSEIPFPFTMQPSRIMVSGMPEGVIAAMPLLEDWGIASRLCSMQGYAGCYEGYVTDLTRHWLDNLQDVLLEQVEIFSCGPTPMLAAVARLAHEYGLPCQVSLEEYMACAVGGCAGCTVYTRTENGPAMKRVCVDGPIFDASSVFPV